jgi:hypothetical protein
MIRRIATLAVLGLITIPALARADAVHDWNTIMLRTISGQSPFAQARFAAITQLAVFEAVNACNGVYEPYLGTLIAQPGASPEAAAIAAAHDVLANYFPGSVGVLDAARTTSLATIPDGSAKHDGLTVGAAAAAAMIALRANDGSAPLEVFVPASNDPGVWQPTPPGFGPGILFNWRNVTPFGVETSDQFRSDPPPALTSERYTRDYNEVMTMGELNSAARPQDRSDVARFYAAAPPTQVWNQAAQQVSMAQGRSLSQNARAFAILNMAISDALVSVFDTKYFYIRWRPVTAIRAGGIDGNPKTDADANWTPLIATPSFPGYPSAHGSASGAAREVLERLFDAGRHDITLTTPSLPAVTLQYTHFREITDDIDDARVYGGIHFRFDQEAGGRLGRSVGAYIYQHHLRRVDRD